STMRAPARLASRAAATPSALLRWTTWTSRPVRWEMTPSDAIATASASAGREASRSAYVRTRRAKERRMSGSSQCTASRAPPPPRRVGRQRCYRAAPGRRLQLRVALPGCIDALPVRPANCIAEERLQSDHTGVEQAMHILGAAFAAEKPPKSEVDQCPG